MIKGYYLIYNKIYYLIPTVLPIKSGKLPTCKLELDINIYRY